MQSQNDIVIAVMGATGAGKSTFVNLASGTTLGVWNGLKSYTSSVTCSPSFTLKGRNVVLIDTPGFDDTAISDTDILKMIALHLSKTYEMGIKLSGVIYLHRISDNRMGGISRRNFSMFRKLCGEETLRNVVIATTMWGLVDPILGQAREKELQTDQDLFKPVLDKGARMVRLYSTSDSAQHIVQNIMDNHPTPLRIQRELVDEKKDISKTEAGEELNRELTAMAKKHEEELRQVREEMKEALAQKDRIMKEELEEHRQKLEARMQEINQDRERLSREYAEEKKRVDERMRKVMSDLEFEKGARASGNLEVERLTRELHNLSLRSAQQEQELRSQINSARNSRRGEPGVFSYLGAAMDALFNL